MADFPGSIFDPREVENLPGISYDAAKTKVLYAEDLNAATAEIVAVEETLGENPQGAFSTVRDWLDSIAAFILQTITICGHAVGLGDSIQLYDTDLAGTTNGAIPYVSSGFLIENQPGLNISPSTMTLNVSDGTNGNASLSGGSSPAITVKRYSTPNAGPLSVLSRIRGSKTSPSAVAQNDILGTYRFNGYDGAAERTAAQFVGTVISPTPSSTNFAGRFTFSLVPLGSASVSEVARLEYDTGLSMYGANKVIDQNRLFVFRAYTVAALPTGVSAYSRAFVTDATVGLAAGLGAAPTGGGANKVPVYTVDGTNWLIG